MQFILTLPFRPLPYWKYILSLSALCIDCLIICDTFWYVRLMNKHTQQTRNHIWTSWQVSYWFIIGTALPVRVFMCIHVNTRVLSVVTGFEWVWHELYWGRTGTVSLVRLITWKTRDFTGNTYQHQICSQNPVNSRELNQLNSWIHLQNKWNHGTLFAGISYEMSIKWSC